MATFIKSYRNRALTSIGDGVSFGEDAPLVVTRAAWAILMEGHRDRQKDNKTDLPTTDTVGYCPDCGCEHYDTDGFLPVGDMCMCCGGNKVRSLADLIYDGLVLIV